MSEEQTIFYGDYRFTIDPSVPEGMILFQTEKDRKYILGVLDLNDELDGVCTNQTLDKFKQMKAMQALQSDLRTLAEALCAISKGIDLDMLAMDGKIIGSAARNHAPAITLAQGILEGK